MADHFTTRLQLPYPDLDDPADVPADMQQLAERLDVLIPGSGAGSVLNRVTVGDVGMAGQIRAGRQLTAVDFTALGLSAPLGLWNLSDLADVSGNNRPLLTKGAVGFAPGINGLANTAAQFTGSAAQALYIADTGAADPFRIKAGSWGCWFRTAKRGVAQILLSKDGTQRGWDIRIVGGNVIQVGINADAAGTMQAFGTGVSDMADDRWHLAVAVHDGTILRLYVDGVLESSAFGAFTIFGSTAPFNVGAAAADAGTAASSPHYGRVDEAFVTADVLSEEQMRALYCARLPHGYAVVPSDVKLNVTRRRRGGAFAVADFTTQPLRLHNFTGGVLTDQGSNGTTLVNNGAAVSVAGADGTAGSAYGFAGAQSLSATDAGLPGALASRSYGCWLKSATATGFPIAFGWGTSGSGEAEIFLSNGAIGSINGADQITGPFVADGQWHHVIVVEENAAADGVRRKLYLDGRLVVGSTVLVAITLAGADRFRIGGRPDALGTLWTGQLDGVFVCGYAIGAAEVARLYGKGSQALAPSPKSPGAHVEGWDAAAIYATFDTLDSHWQVDLGVSA